MKGTATTQSRRPAALHAVLTPFLLCIIGIPSGLFYMGLASSMAIGSMIVSSLALILVFILLSVSRRRLLHASYFLFFIPATIVLHLLTAAVLGPVNISRGIESLLPLCVCVSGGWAFAALFTHAHSIDLTRALKRCFVLLGVITLLGAAGWLQPPTTSQYSKSVFPFSEPSHLALVFAPFLIFSCISSTLWKRTLNLAVAFLGTALLENLTMAAACFLAATICLKPRYILLLALSLTPVLATLDLSYYSGRLVFDIDGQNLSSLVYLQGWQMLEESLVYTHGFGLGFQQLGVFGTNVTASDQINLLMGESLNLLDGGFNMTKLLSEFGILGALLLAAYLYYLIRSIRLLRRVALYGEYHPAVLIFSASCIVGYLIELLFRGTGYFTPTGILLVFALLTWRHFDKSLYNIKLIWRGAPINSNA